MTTELSTMLPDGTEPVDAQRWRWLVDLDGVTLPIVFEVVDEVFLAHLTIAGLPVTAIGSALLELDRVVRRVKIGAADGMVTVWGELDLDSVDRRRLELLTTAIRTTGAQVLALGAVSLGGPAARVVSG